MLLVPFALAAAPTPLWVEAPDRADRVAAARAGLRWAEGVDGDWLLLEGEPAQAEAAGLRWRLAAEDPDGWSPTVDEVEDRLRALDGNIVQIGESVLGRPILAIRFGSGSRALRILGGHHGNEGASIEVALRVAEALDGATLPADTEVWVVPLVNPDGLAADTRANANGVDLNRNYGEQWRDGSTGGDAAFSEPETRAIRALARARAFDAGLSVHSGASNLGWVWNWTSDERPADEPALSAIAADYADSCTAPDFWITEGADWYVTNGDTTDWTYARWGAWDYTLEVSSVKSPPFEEVETYVAWHLDAVLAWIARAPGSPASIVDDVTGEPIPATLAGAGAAFTTPTGAVARWSDANTAVSAPGYADASLGEETRLSPTSLLETLPSPRLLSRGGGPTAVTLPGASGALTLSQPGEAPVVLEANEDTWTVDPAALAPGAWTLTVAEGTAPRALFIGEVDDRVALDSATLDGTLLTLEGVGFAEGAEAWSIGGPARAMHALVPLGQIGRAHV